MYIRENVRKGDVVVSYQSEGRRICGFSQMADDGFDDPKGSGDFNTLYLCSAKRGLCIEPELSVEQLRATGCDPVWLPEGQGTVFPVSSDEFKGIIRAVRICCPGMEANLEAWLGRAGVEADVYTAVEFADRKPKAPRGGAGFSSNTARNAQVEQAAVRIVTRDFIKRKWEVEDVQDACLGFDLICTKGRKRVDVEVKGTAGSRASFPITYGEVRQAETNANFAIWIVTEALSPKPIVQQLSGPKFLAEFKLQPIQYMATKLS